MEIAGCCGGCVWSCGESAGAGAASRVRVHTAGGVRLGNAIPRHGDGATEPECRLRDGEGAGGSVGPGTLQGNDQGVNAVRGPAAGDGPEPKRAGLDRGATEELWLHEHGADQVRLPASATARSEFCEAWRWRNAGDGAAARTWSSGRIYKARRNHQAQGVIRSRNGWG